MRIGLLVEGVCPGINNFICTLVQGSDDAVIGFSKGWQGLYQDESFLMNTSGALNFKDLGGSILPTSSSGDVGKDWKYKMMENLLKYKIDFLIVFGNEHSVGLVNELSSAGIKVILIPSADFDLNIDSYRIGFDTLLNRLSQCIYRSKEFSKTSGRKIVLCLSWRFRGFVERLKSIHSFDSKEVSDQIFISWNRPFEDIDCLVKIDGLLSAGRPLKKDLSFAENLAKAILSRSSLRGGTVLIYNEGFEFLSLQSFQQALLLKGVEGGAT